jgi:A/G-specific adenine glycosylase
MICMITSHYDFQETAWQHYHQAGRHDLPWRLAEPDGSFDPYKIMVSELMLQQTQVNRVIAKYDEFLALFPTVAVLAAAPLGDVLRAWSGLGYNRRAKFLHQAAQQIQSEYGGVFPQTAPALVALPGIGVNTAGAILAYAFNQPVVFIETNIRTVFIHHFFDDRDGVADAEIFALVSETLDHEQPREWYWALMDYGAFLKQTVGNRNRQSKSYAKQSTFHGSRRQIRGQVLRLLGQRPHTATELAEQIADERLPGVLTDLVAEQLIRLQGRSYTL